MTASFWDAHVDAFMRTVGETPDSQRYYEGRHRGFYGELTEWTRVECARVAAERADRAVVVLAATDSLPASRLLYRELLRAGALSNAERAS